MSGPAFLRKLNAILTIVMVVLLCVHAVGNALQLVGAGALTSSAIAWALLVVACLHAAIGLVLTIGAFEAQAEAGKAYLGLNRRFWTARASGLAIAVFVVVHVLLFAQFDDGPVRLAYFGPLQLATQILLVLSLAVHVIANLEPLMISLGIASPKGRAMDVLCALAVVLLLAAVAFVVYYLRWSVV